LTPKKGFEQLPTFASSAVHKFQAAHGGPQLFSCQSKTQAEHYFPDLMFILMLWVRQEVRGNLDANQLFTLTLQLTCSKSKVIGMLFSSFSKSTAPSWRGETERVPQFSVMKCNSLEIHSESWIQREKDQQAFPKTLSRWLLGLLFQTDSRSCNLDAPEVLE